MGQAKRIMDEIESRGWASSDKFVCNDCVEDDFLQWRISQAVSKRKCDYCGKAAKKPIAASLDVIIEPVMRTLHRYFAEPENAGLPHDRDLGLYNFCVDTMESLLDLGLEGEATLLEDVADSICGDCWYPCADGHWLDIHKHQELKGSWFDFVNEIQHTSRFFFTQTDRGDSNIPGERYSSVTMLQMIGRMINNFNLHRAILPETDLWRVREISKGDELTEFENIGPPPKEIASAGRMNPPGISYFYTALEQQTAIQEIITRPPTHIAIAKFSSDKSIRVIDFSDIPILPSIFDVDRSDDYESILFLDHFISEITKPVPGDRKEHINYVPSQVVCEYFAKIFRFKDGNRPDGILYPSTINPGGHNVVMFPPEFPDSWKNRFSVKSIQHKSCKTWNDIFSVTSK